MQAVAEGGQRSTYSVPGGVKAWGKNGAGCGPGARSHYPFPSYSKSLGILNSIWLSRL